MRCTSLAAALIGAITLVLPTMSTFAAPAPGANNRVLVVPFVTLNVATDKQWIGKGVQETIIADLGHTDAYSPIAFNGQVIVEDNATAAKLGQDANAGYAVRGAAQVVNSEVRLTAQMIDAKSGDTVATGIATGKLDDLLKLEDDLANQLRIGPLPAGGSSVPVYTTPSSGYVPRSNAAPATAIPAAANLNQPLNVGSYTAPSYDDYQSYGVPAYYYSPVYTPSYLDYYPYTYADTGCAYPYYPIYPVTVFGVGGGGFYRRGLESGFHPGFHAGLGSGFSIHSSFHAGSFSGSFSTGHGGRR